MADDSLSYHTASGASSRVHPVYTPGKVMLDAVLLQCLPCGHSGSAAPPRPTKPTAGVQGRHDKTYARYTWQPSNRVSMRGVRSNAVQNKKEPDRQASEATMNEHCTLRYIKVRRERKLRRTLGRTTTILNPVMWYWEQAQEFLNHPQHRRARAISSSSRYSTT